MSLVYREYLTLAMMHANVVPPPAIAYVRETGDYYLSHTPAYWNGAATEGAQWVRMQSSGSAANILAITTEDLRTKALTTLTRTVVNGKRNFTPTEWGATYDHTIARTLDVVRSTYYAESNRLSEGDDRYYMYPLRSGDLAVDKGNRPFFIHGKIGNTGPLPFNGYNLERIGLEPLRKGTPGLHSQLAIPRVSPTQVHNERIGYVVTSDVVPRGATSFVAAIHTDSCPPGEIGGGVPWDVQHFTTGGTPTPLVTAPTTGPWQTRREAYLAAPYQYVDIGVTYTDVAGGTLPHALETVLTLDRPCPMPLYTGGALFQQPTGEYFIDPYRVAFSWMPLGVYGDHLGATEIPVRISGQGAEHMDAGHANGGAHVGDTELNLYKSWIGPVGQRRFSELRGIAVNDLVTLGNNPRTYRVTQVNANELENPSSIKIAPAVVEDALGATQSSLGYWLSNIKVHRISGFDRGGMIWRCLGWSFPDEQLAVPLMVKSISDGVVTLHAPVPEDIPAGTRMNLWPMCDVETLTYAYHDDSAFYHQLEIYNRVTFSITRESLQEIVDNLGEKLAKLQRARERAVEEASVFWFRPPFYVNREINAWLPAEYREFGSSFSEVQAELQRRVQAVGKLLQTPVPNLYEVEYLNLLNYGRGEV